MLGFVYLWYDKKRKKFYLGSHIGSLNDGYVGSNYRLKCAYKNRPDTFKRRILEKHTNINSKQLLQREQFWLNLIKPEELSVRYYNEKKFATGGNIVGMLSEEKKENHRKMSGIAARKYWDNITEEEYKKRKENAFGGNKFDRSYMSERNKELCSRTAIICHPNGEKEKVLNISEFCRIHNINYGNMKTVLRGNGKQKSCKGFTGYYI